MTTRIRPAFAADAPVILGLVKRFLESTPYGTVLTYNPDTLGELIVLVLEQEMGCVFLGQVEVSPGLWRSVAIIGGIAGKHPITGEGTVEELVWWVDPEGRSTRLGYRLLGRLEEWARQNGHILLKMVAPTTVDAHGQLSCQVGEFYTRMGYRPIETAYIKRL